MTDYLEIQTKWNSSDSVKEVAEAFKMTEGAVKALVSRMRKRDWQMKPLARGRKRMPSGSGAA